MDECKKTPLRLATVGSGMIVDAFLFGLKGVPALRHTAVYSRREESGQAFAEKHGLGAEAVWTDLTALAKSGTVDCVYLATPNALHAHQAEIFLNEGVHVLCEKPATLSPAELERVIDAADAHHAVFMEAIMAPHQPRFQLLQDAVGKLGTLSGAIFNFSQLSSRYPAFLAGERPNIFNMALGAGSLMDIGVYDVYLALALFGKPERIDASAHFLENGADGCGSALFRYDWGDCLLSWSKIAQSRGVSEILGDKGTLTFAPVSRVLDLTLYPTGGERTLLFGEEPHSDSLGNEARDFARYILQPAKTQTEYRAFLQLARDCAAVMEEIREKSGIRFA